MARHSLWAVWVAMKLLRHLFVVEYLFCVPFCFGKKNDNLLRTSRTWGSAQHWESPCLVEDELTTPSAPHSLSSAVKLLQWQLQETSKATHLSASVYLLGPGLSFSCLIFKHDPFCLLRHTGLVVPSSLASWLGSDAFSASPLDGYWSQALTCTYSTFGSAVPLTHTWPSLTWMCARCYTYCVYPKLLALKLSLSKPVLSNFPNPVLRNDPALCPGTQPKT